MSLTIIKNTTGYVNAPLSITDTGWTVSAGKAIHASCNAGIIKSLTGLGMIVGRQYTITYDVESRTSGGVNVICGAAAGTTRTANGSYTQTLTCTTLAQLSFYSDGNLTISNVKFYDTALGMQGGTTISFHEDSNTWGAEYPMEVEQLIKFANQFFTIKNGQLWLHDSNPVYNNLHSVQYVSKIKFYDNIDPTTQKVFYSIRVVANTRWFAPNNGDIKIVPVVGRSLGMSSRLKRNNFKNYQGSFFADFMRNYLDSRFNDPEIALYKGEPLRGRYMEITLTNDDTTEAILFEIDIKSSASNYTY